MKVGAVVTTVLDLIGIVCLAAFAWFVWPPAALLPIAAGALFASWSAQRGESPSAMELRARARRVERGKP